MLWLKDVHICQDKDINVCMSVCRYIYIYVKLYFHKISKQKVCWDIPSFMGHVRKRDQEAPDPHYYMLIPNLESLLFTIYVLKLFWEKKVRGIENTTGRYLQA